jgi:hypothetical protein
MLNVVAPILDNEQKHTVVFAKVLMNVFRNPELIRKIIVSFLRPRHPFQKSELEMIVRL